MQEIQVQFLGQEDPLEKEMATHSSILAWRIPWTEEPGGLQVVKSQTQLKQLSMHIYITIEEIPRSEISGTKSKMHL